MRLLSSSIPLRAITVFGIVHEIIIIASCVGVKIQVLQRIRCFCRALRFECAKEILEGGCVVLVSDAMCKQQVVIHTLLV